MKKATYIVSVALLALTLWCSPVAAQNIYGEDLAWRLANPSEIRQATTIRSRLRKEATQGEALFVLAPPPFGEIETAPNTQQMVTARPKQWYLPPWPSLDPALPDDMPDANRKDFEERRQDSQAPETWSELGVSGTEMDSPSVLLRPRPVAPGEEFVFHIKEIPEPFSLRRYYDSEDIYVQVAAFGGTTSFKAEEAYRAMKEAATKQEPLEGIGEEAFMTRVVIIDPSTIPPPAEIDFVDGPALPVPPPFAEIDPSDDARPELNDSGRAVALSAPAFTDLPVAGLEGKRIKFPTAAKKYLPKGGEVKQSFLVIVAFFPDQAVTLTMALEERMGNIQDLVAVAILAQSNLRDIAEHD